MREEREEDTRRNQKESIGSPGHVVTIRSSPVPRADNRHGRRELRPGPGVRGGQAGRAHDSPRPVRRRGPVDQRETPSSHLHVRHRAAKDRARHHQQGLGAGRRDLHNPRGAGAVHPAVPPVGRGVHPPERAGAQRVEGDRDVEPGLHGGHSPRLPGGGSVLRVPERPELRAGDMRGRGDRGRHRERGHHARGRPGRAHGRRGLRRVHVQGRDRHRGRRGGEERHSDSGGHVRGTRSGDQRPVGPRHSRVRRDAPSGNLPGSAPEHHIRPVGRRRHVRDVLRSTLAQ
mmetsp:Transcript_16736/g.38861  ORF Transcript_16736/g.38861 Transcript_16736/m.38861 type:complete len:287 (+) Transcript_16736:379-1239(+)